MESHVIANYVRCILAHCVCARVVYVHFSYYLFSSSENKNLFADVKWENVAESGSEKREKKI